jgi:UDP-N-acetylglucosamine/UDP-N-acetylgalactosamine diphosphorylase
VLAGGDASRLGLPIPKGMFNPGIQGIESIFELIVEKVKKVEALCREQHPELPALDRDSVVLVIMTNPENFGIISEFFKSHEYFGHKSTIIFPQSNLPVTDPHGRILFKSRNKVLFAPDGNGSFFHSRNGKRVFQRLASEGVEYLHITGVDNILCKWAEPLPVGLLEQTGADVVCKYAPKKHALERVGVFAMSNDKPSIIEYTLIGDELAQKTDEHGELFFNHSNILNYMFRLKYLQAAVLTDECLQELNTRFNHSLKDASFFDPVQNQLVQGKVIKFELFLNESITFCAPEKFFLLECLRDQVKSAHQELRADKELYETSIRQSPDRAAALQQIPCNSPTASRLPNRE